MDLGPALFSVCVTMVCLLGAARCSNTDTINCPCSRIPLLNLTEAPSETCIEATRFRYKCLGGYKRKAGTSDLIKCKEINGEAQWTPSSPTLQCIRDPMITTTQPPKPTETKGHTDNPDDSNITTTVTAEPTSPQTTQSINATASVTAETFRTEPTSSDQEVHSDRPNVDIGRGTDETDRTTSASTTAEPAYNGTVNPVVSDNKFSSGTTTMIVFAPLVIICILIGIGFSYYKRKSKSNIPRHTVEEEIPMNDE